MKPINQKYHQQRPNVFTVKNKLQKTELCRLYQQGKCFKIQCQFAHTEQEIRAKPNLYKTRLCIAFQNGNCLKNNCQYAHGNEQLRSTEDFYKTVYCDYWKQCLTCPNGQKCRFAHGHEELKVNYDLTQENQNQNKLFDKNNFESKQNNDFFKPWEFNQNFYEIPFYNYNQHNHYDQYYSISQEKNNFIDVQEPVTQYNTISKI